MATIPTAPNLQNLTAPNGYSGIIPQGMGNGTPSGFQTGKQYERLRPVGEDPDAANWQLQGSYYNKGYNAGSSFGGPSFGQDYGLYTYLGAPNSTGAPAPGASPAGSAGGAMYPGGSTIPGPSGSPAMGGTGAPGNVSFPGGGIAAPTGINATQTANPWSVAASGSAVQAGQQAGGQAGANFGQANNMRTGANSLQTGANAVMNTAFDPQNALYDRTRQQVQDASRVSQAVRGITMSPYGAGLENQAMTNFNIDWQNAQLARQAQGLGAAGTATNSAGTANVTGANLGQQGVGQTQATGQIPYDSYMQDQQNNIQNWIAFMNQNNAVSGLAQQNYPNQLAYQSMQQAGGVPYIPSGNTFNF